jgi:lipoprotein-releasing system permease protein
VVGVVPADAAGPGRPGADSATDVTSVRRHVTLGDFTFRTGGGERRGAVLGKRLAEQLNVFPGDKISIVTRAGVTVNPVTGTPVPNFEEFTVTGVFETGMYEYDNTYLYVDLPLAQRLAGLGEAVTAIEVRTVDRWRAADIARSLADRLGFPYFTRDWQEQNRSLFPGAQAREARDGRDPAAHRARGARSTSSAPSRWSSPTRPARSGS